ncbi:class III lanthipeptide [Pseudoscardovia suis]
MNSLLDLQNLEQDEQQSAPWSTLSNNCHQSWSTMSLNC